MSLDLYLSTKQCPTCKNVKVTDSVSYTWNVAPMWYEIYPNQEHMVDVDGLTGKESLPLLECALDMLERNPKKFIAMNPSNGWGDYEGFMAYIKKLIEMANENPDLYWESCR